MFPPETAVAAGNGAGAVPLATATRLQGRYELGQFVGERGGVQRYQGTDTADGRLAPVTILRMELPKAVEPLEGEVVEAAPAGEEGLGFEDILPAFDEPMPVAIPGAGEAAPSGWPSITWERNLLEAAASPGLPAVLDSFVEEGFDYLVLERPTGTSLWDAWDDPDADTKTKYGYLRQVAEALHALHQNGAMLEGIRPDYVVVTESGQAKITDLADLLPLPLPPSAPIKATLYTAPELIFSPQSADARADMYSFGAMIYSLFLGREVTENDFERQGMPKPFIPRFPDIHPLFGRLITKTFCRDLGYRFPTDEAQRKDPTGFQELIQTLDVCGRTLDTVHLEMAAWTTIGMIRTGNEDAYAFIHSTESRIDDVGESALIILCDGMGGYEAGEVAAALAIQTLRKNLVHQKPFKTLSGAGNWPIEGLKTEQDIAVPTDVEGMKKLVMDALKDANKTVYTASRSGVGRRGMGCTAEVVYIDGRNVVVGHVGDSRTYHLHEGRLIQLTRDQTLVNRLVELGQLSEEEAENHPRKNELQQAIGGQPDVQPGVYHAKLQAGDWIVVCSDGVTNHVKNAELQQMLSSEAVSADMAARRLVNFVNINGATDNATIVVVRVV